MVFTVQWLLTPYAGAWKAFMVVASYVFYAWWDWRFIFLLAAATAIAYTGGRLVHPATGPGARWCSGPRWPSCSDCWCWFKYFGFVAVNIDNVTHALGLGRPLPLLTVTLPVGISFFTFMAISYVVDIYRGVLKPARGIDVTVFLAFFPHLIAGPIVRGTELLPQIRSMRDPDDVHYVEAFWLISAGLAKKVVLSSYLSAYVVDPVFAAPRQHSALEVLFAIWGYAVQIYADFSGYTDIAIGLALLMGFRFPVNFKPPYTAIDLQDFWRRWHITLSLWLRDYLYIPLGGNRGSRVPGLAQPAGHHAARRSVARRVLDLRDLGRLPRGRARSSGAGAGRPGSPRACRRARAAGPGWPGPASSPSRWSASAGSSSGPTRSATSSPCSAGWSWAGDRPRW